MVCIHCDEEITEDEFAYPNGGYAHRNCHMRQCIGSVAHVEKRCGCYVEGSVEGDPPGMSRREAANAAVAAWKKIHKQWVN